MHAHDIEDAEGIAPAGAGKSEGKEQSGPGKSAGATEAEGHAEEAEHEPPADGAEELGEERGKESAAEPERIGCVENANRFGA